MTAIVSNSEDAVDLDRCDDATRSATEVAKTPVLDLCHC
jgi:hypothetical protein